MAMVTREIFYCVASASIPSPGRLVLVCVRYLLQYLYSVQSEVQTKECANYRCMYTYLTVLLQLCTAHSSVHASDTYKIHYCTH